MLKLSVSDNHCRTASKVEAVDAAISTLAGSDHAQRSMPRIKLLR